MKNNTEQKIVNAMLNSKGRFFSLTTKNGGLFNAQFVRETPSTVVIYDRNKALHRRVNKSSLDSFGMGSVKIG